MSKATLLSILLAITVSNVGFGMNAGDLVRLKKAGISDKTVQVIVKEKAIETCLVTVDELLELRKAGLSDQTIRAMIDEGSFLNDADPIVYGQEVKSIRSPSVNDLIRMKNAGTDEETIRTIIRYSSIRAEQAERDKAWEMLKNIGILLDKRD
jgi:hypothetical protein